MVGEIFYGAFILQLENLFTNALCIYRIEGAAMKTD